MGRPSSVLSTPEILRLRVEDSISFIINEFEINQLIPCSTTNAIFYLVMFDVPKCNLNFHFEFSGFHTCLAEQIDQREGVDSALLLTVLEIISSIIILEQREVNRIIV